MTLDPELLNAAKAAGTALDDAEKQALLLRGDYHTAVRRLHLAGAPLREIADALSLSHQRVQQIVSGAGGSWWRRVWRTRNVDPGPCTWCGRPPGEVDKLIAGPEVFICDACVREAERAMERDGASRGRFNRAAGRNGLASRCAFCRKRPGRDRTLATATAGHVCSDCLRVCREILDGRAA